MGIRLNRYARMQRHIEVPLERLETLENEELQPAQRLEIQKSQQRFAALQNKVDRTPTEHGREIHRLHIEKQRELRKEHKQHVVMGVTGCRQILAVKWTALHALRLARRVTATIICASCFIDLALSIFHGP